MNAIFDNFTGADLRNYETKKNGLLSFEDADSLEAQRQRRKQENIRNIIRRL